MTKISRRQLLTIPLRRSKINTHGSGTVFFIALAAPISISDIL